jgi:hypothetical protein
MTVSPELQAGSIQPICNSWSRIFPRGKARVAGGDGSADMRLPAEAPSTKMMGNLPWRMIPGRRFFARLNQSFSLFVKASSTVPT